MASNFGLNILCGGVDGGDVVKGEKFGYANDRGVERKRVFRKPDSVLKIEWSPLNFIQILHVGFSRRCWCIQC